MQQNALGHIVFCIRGLIIYVIHGIQTTNCQEAEEDMGAEVERKVLECCPFTFLYGHGSV
jgi:hypothetical protein